jgi:hypothetical protein
MKPKFIRVQTRRIKIPGRCELGGFEFLHVSLKTSKPDCVKPAGFLLVHVLTIPSPHLDLPLQDQASLSLHPYLWAPSLALFDLYRRSTKIITDNASSHCAFFVVFSFTTALRKFWFFFFFVRRTKKAKAKEICGELRYMAKPWSGVEAFRQDHEGG